VSLIQRAGRELDDHFEDYCVDINARKKLLKHFYVNIRKAFPNLEVGEAKENWLYDHMYNSQVTYVINPNIARKDYVEFYHLRYYGDGRWSQD
jgi:hypothetical protein